MKKLRMFIPLVVLCCLAVGCQQDDRVLVESLLEPEADIQAIKDIIEGWNAAQNAGDVNGKMSHVADDMVLIPPDGPAIIGREAIQNNYQQLSDLYASREEDEVVDVHISRDLAVAHATWKSAVFPKTGDDSFTAIVDLDKSGEASIEAIESEGGKRMLNGNWIIVFKRQPGGSWNCIYSIFSNESLVSPTQTE